MRNSDCRAGGFSCTCSLRLRWAALAAVVFRSETVWGKRVRHLPLSLVKAIRWVLRGVVRTLSLIDETIELVMWCRNSWDSLLPDVAP
ncbi:unnamed protein product [Periconia digitata]|uniref:Uncharacterized protein n=1 Tax=Periconia digitata TaxID=1303443 RepID=A0A9W4XGC4_9PLEO|nr:unnamed protein product [Periconia digitata]